MKSDPDPGEPAREDEPGQHQDRADGQEGAGRRMRRGEDVSESAGMSHDGRPVIQVYPRLVSPLLQPP